MLRNSSSGFDEPLIRYHVCVLFSLIEFNTCLANGTSSVIMPSIFHEKKFIIVFAVINCVSMHSKALFLPFLDQSLLSIIYPWMDSLDREDNDQ